MSSVPVPGGELWADQAGSGPAVVLVHAGIADHTMWDAQVEPLAAAHTVVRIDQRGFGRSRWEEQEFRRDDDIRAVLDHLGLDRAVLLGCSLGGAACLDVAVGTSDCVSGLVWVCGGVSGLEHEGFPEEETAMFERAEALWEAKEFDELVDLETHIWVDGPLAPDDRAPAPVREHVARMIREIETREQAQPTALPPEVPAVDNLDRIDCPVLVLIGGHDTHGTRASADYLSSHLPGAERVDFPDSAHVPNMEHPERFNEALLGFLERHGL